MSIDWFRDLVISIFGLVATGTVIFLAVISYKIYRRAVSILDSVETTSATIKRISTYAGEEVAKPLIQVAALIQGIRQGIDAVTKLFKKKGGKSDV